MLIPYPFELLKDANLVPIAEVYRVEKKNTTHGTVLFLNSATKKKLCNSPRNKPERPLRLITSTGSPTCAVSQRLVSILAPPRKNNYTVKNSSEFVHEPKQYSIANDEVYMVSFDVKSFNIHFH